MRTVDRCDTVERHTDAVFPGGLYAATNVYADEDLGERLQTLVASLDENQFYQIDYSFLLTASSCA